MWSMTFYNGQFDTYRGWMKPTYEKESAAAEQSSREEAKKTIPENLVNLLDVAHELPHL